MGGFWPDRREVIRAMRFIRKILAKEGWSLAGIILIMSLVVFVVGVGLGNYFIRIVAGPRSPESESPQEQVDVTWEEEIVEEIEEEAPAPMAELPPEEREEVEEEEVEVEQVLEEEGFMVQAGVFNSLDNAQRLKNILEEEGFRVWVTDSQPYRVHLGIFSERAEAEEIRDEAERKGFEVFIAH